MRSIIVTRFIYLFLLGVGLRSAVSEARDYPEFPAADFMHVKIVSEEMVVNGLPMAAYQFSTQQSPSSVADFYSQEWGDDKMTDIVFGDWRILSHRDGDYLLTVQIENNSDIATHGTLGMTPAFEYLSKSKSSLKANAAKVGDGFPSLSGTEVLNDIRAIDQGSESRTVMFKNRSSIKANLEFYRKKMSLKGWQDISPDTPKKLRAKLDALAMNRNGRQFNLSFSEVAGETYGVAIYVR